MTGSLTLSEYMADRFSIRSEIAWSLLRTTISLPRSRTYRISVSFRRQVRIVTKRNDLAAYHDGWTTR